jgi:LmbE family N-acetylglucosaminyl deacetylase
MVDTPNKQLRILSIGAHPADMFDQCAGTMAHHAKRGDYIACISLTHGARVHDKIIANQMQNSDSVPDSAELLKLIAERSDIKAQEIRAAGRILGFEDIYFLGEEDDILMVTKEAVRVVSRLIRQIKPDVILTHFPREGDGLTNPHAVCGQIVMHAVQFANAVDPGDRNPPHRIAQMFFFGEGAAHLPNNVFDARRSHYNEVFIDITDVIDKKLAAMDCLVSQGYAGIYARKRLETSDGAFGGGYSYGEAFIKMRAENHYYLPVPEMMLETAKLSDHDLMNRYSWRFPID